MLKKVIQYNDFNDKERNEEFYFNLTKAEIMEMEFGKSGGFENYIKRIINSENTVEIIKVFKQLILRSYGEKSDDGKRFIKSKEIADAFSQTEAYSNLFMELSTNTQEAINFINGIIPKEIAEKIPEEVEKNPEKIIPFSNEAPTTKE